MKAATLLRPAIDEDADRILAWRNPPEVRRVMFTDQLISVSEHAAWWARQRTNPDYRLLMIEHAGEPCGVVTYSRIPEREACWLWGFYFNPEAFSDGTERLRAWANMEQAAINYARDELACHTLCGEVFAFNTAVLAMHLRYRFQETGRYLRPRGDETLEVIQLERNLS